MSSLCVYVCGYIHHALPLTTPLHHAGWLCATPHLYPAVLSCPLSLLQPVPVVLYRSASRPNGVMLLDFSSHMARHQMALRVCVCV